MSQRDLDTLDQSLGGLQINKEVTGKPKKIPPAVPPKKKTLQNVAVNFRDPQDSTSSAQLRFDQMNADQNKYTSYNNDNTLVPSQSNLRNFSSGNLKYATYSNIPSYNNNDLLPIPPPPMPVNKFNDINPNMEVFLPPPSSPVSSNYSELARANLNMRDNSQGAPFYQNEFLGYGSSRNPTYEPLYEPIENNNPTKGHYQHYKGSLSNTTDMLPKEAEVDNLTDLLVKSISDNQDPDYFGICEKCNGKVLGENSGCTAMGNLYHVECFTCHQCNVNLHGKRLYAVEGQPYCEIDYLETLEKCSVCKKPILDRILRATGNPYHQECFTCVACGKSLDGVPFTVDAMNQIHCIEDFHKKFAPRCCVCELPIMPEEGQEETVRVVALDRSFHVRCYRCEDCGLLLSSEAEGRGCYPLDDHILCKTCNAYRIRLLTNVMTTDL